MACALLTSEGELRENLKELKRTRPRGVGRTYGSSSAWFRKGAVYDGSGIVMNGTGSVRVTYCCGVFGQLV